jgi:PAS domain S-box-containing protein
MTCKPAYEDLEQKVKELEKKNSELKQRDEKIRENEWVLNQAQSIASIGCWYMDIQKGASGLSDELYKLYGVDREFDCTAKNIIERLVHPDDRERVQSAFEKAFEGMLQPAMEWRIVRPDGTERIMYSRGAKVSLDKNNNPSKIIAPVQDITEFRQLERGLIRSERRLRKLFEESNDAIFIHDLEGKIYDLNQAAFNMTGYPKASLLEMIVADLHPDADQQDAYQALEEIRRNGHARFQSKFMRADKSIITVDISSSVIDEEGGLVQGLVRDITKQRQMENQLRQAQRIEAIGTLAGGIAHDFNNILSPIILHTDMVLEDIPVSSPIRFNLEEIRSASIRARDLTKQILTFSSQTEQEKTPVTIRPIIKETLKLLRYSFPSTIDIRQTVEDADGAVLADQTQIQRILMNLCTNAAYAMREKGGVLEVGLASVYLSSADTIQHTNLEPGHYMKLIVRDTGPGIESGVIDRIFEPYYTTKEKGEGTGMGLAVVHGIVKNYDGAITVDSEPGKGTVFQLFLPKNKEQISFEPKEAFQLPVGTERILLIDDEQIILEVMQQMLERLGYSVYARSDSTEALEAFRENSDGFDLVITDYTMPEITGADLAKAIMGIRSDVPVILCTGFSEQIDEEKSKSIGIQAFVMKPIIMEEMAKTIRKVLDNDQLNIEVKNGEHINC